MWVRTQVMTAKTIRPSTTEIRRYFSTAASPMRMEPWKAVGSSRGRASGPQTTLMSSSPTIMPPMVMRICFRGWP